MLHSADFADILYPALREIFFNTYQMHPGKKELLFTHIESKNGSELFRSVGALSQLKAFGHDGNPAVVQYDESAAGFPVTFTHKEYALGVKIERALFDDELYQIMKGRVQSLGAAAFRRIEGDASSVFENAFNDSFPGGDGRALCSDYHPVGTPEGVSSGIFSNKGSEELSEAALANAEERMRGFVDDRGQVIRVIPDLLLVPRHLENKAIEILRSKQLPNVNTVNVWNEKGWKLLVWEYLNDQDNWFLIDTTMMKQFLYWIDRIPLEFEKDQEFETLVAKFRAYARYSYGFTDWRFIFGSNPV